MARMLFVTWRDGSDPSQFSVPPGSTLDELLNHAGFADQPSGNELHLHTDSIRTAYLLDVPDGTFIHRLEHADVHPTHDDQQP